MFTTPASEYMSRSLISVSPETHLDEITRLLEQRDISSVPVVDEHGAPVGIVSSTDLLRDAIAHLGKSGGPARTARDVMVTTLIGIDHAQPIRDAAHAMVIHRIHRVLVYRGDRAVGVVSTRDVMRAVLFHHIELPLSQVMTSPVATCDVGERIDAAIARLDEKNVRGLVVTDGDFPVGLFTQAEALKARALPGEILAMPVEQVMSYAITTLPTDTPLYRVAGHAIAVRTRRVLAIEGRTLKGIATGFDLARVATLDL
jgi:predicted transcriptional regulator